MTPPRLPAYQSKRPMYQGKATVPLRLPRKAPPCFDSQAQWDEYRRLAQYTAGDGFTYCTDCNAAHKATMQEQGRCKYPGTVFVKRTGVIVGRRRTIQ